jgi:deferrochelatase/peroxidase EfeB
LKLTRKQLLGGAAAGALGAAGIYELVDQLAESPERAAALELPPEQHLLAGMKTFEHEGVEVIEPPLHHQVVTAQLRVEQSPRALRAARATLEDALRGLERRYDLTPAGLAVTVAWGRPYFQRYVPDLAGRHIPVDRRATRSTDRPVSALLDAVRFPSDPEDTIMEANDVAILLRSDVREHVADGASRLFDETADLFELTSIRKGFQGGGFTGGRSLPKVMATAAGVSGADLIPDGAQLFLGFTSTQVHTQGQSSIANFETLGLVDVGDGYFRGGTNMHLSHLHEDLEAWYLDFDFRERVDTTFRPRLEASDGAQTLAQPPEDAVGAAEVENDFKRFGAIGHGSSIQPTSRLQMDIRGADGRLYRKGSPIPLRADFNTLDNPFFWTADPDGDGFDESPSAGVHFVTFNPSSDDFNRNRLAMDGVLPGGTRLPIQPRARAQGLNSVLRTTHRQNFLVPPRSRRSFPLTELLGA